VHAFILLLRADAQVFLRATRRAQAQTAEARYAALEEEHATARACGGLGVLHALGCATTRHCGCGASSAPACPLPSQVRADRDRLVEAAAAAERANTALWPLPLPIVHQIFSLLPLQTRLRCREVCRGWRGVLAEPSLWARLQLTAASGVRADGVGGGGTWDTLLLCASACAAGGLQSLEVDEEHVSDGTLLAAAAANAGALTELRVRARVRADGGWLACRDAHALLHAAPLLRVFDADRVRCPDVAAACGILRNEPPFGPLRVRQLAASSKPKCLADSAPSAMSLAAAVAAHASLTALELTDVTLDTPAALDAVVGAALARRLQTVALLNGGLSPASAPALARLLGSDALTTLVLSGSSRLLNAFAVRTLAAALRANSTLTSLTLSGVGLWSDLAAAGELLGALSGHASLRALCVARCTLGLSDQAAAGACLGALVAANAPALTELDVSDCRARDDALRPLFEALRGNAHLATLRCCEYNHMSEEFQRDTLLPAVRANASLRALPAGSWLKRQVTLELNAIMQRRAAQQQ
jgi:hypothetical protein